MVPQIWHRTADLGKFRVKDNQRDHNQTQAVAHEIRGMNPDRGYLESDEKT